MNFADELNKGKTKGTWKDDYDASCQQYSVNPIFSSQSIICDETICKISNCQLQLNVWHALLSAYKYAETNTKLMEISLYNVELTDGHLNALLLILGKLAYLPVLKLEYVSFNIEISDMIKVSENLSNLFSNAYFIDYISLKGLQIESATINIPNESSTTDGNDSNFLMHLKIYERLKTNFFIKALNLSNIDFTTEDSTNLIHAIKLCPSLKYLSLSKTNLNNSFLDTILKLKSSGLSLTAEEESNWKKNQKIISDKLNKDIKEKNKNRKKLNLDQSGSIPEIVINPISLVIEKDKDASVGKEQVFIVKNNTICLVDLSNNKEVDCTILKEQLTGMLNTYPSSTTIPNLKLLLSPSAVAGNASSASEIEEYGNVTIVYSATNAAGF